MSGKNILDEQKIVNDIAIAERGNTIVQPGKYKENFAERPSGLTRLCTIGKNVTGLQPGGPNPNVGWFVDGTHSGS